MARAVISPYVETTRHGETVSIPACVVDTVCDNWSSSDTPDASLSVGSRFVFMDDAHTDAAVTLGYVEVSL